MGMFIFEIVGRVIKKNYQNAFKYVLIQEL